MNNQKHSHRKPVGMNEQIYDFHEYDSAASKRGRLLETQEFTSHDKALVFAQEATDEHKCDIIFAGRHTSGYVDFAYYVGRVLRYSTIDKRKLDRE